MHKIIYLFPFFLISFFSYAQQLILEHNLLNSDFKIQQAYSISDTETGDLALFFIGKEAVKSYRYDKGFKVRDSLSFASLPRKYGEILGHQIDGAGEYSIILSNEGHSRFGRLTCSFNNGKTAKKEIALELKGEKFLAAFESGKRFYILTINKKLEALIFYYLNDNGEFEQSAVGVKQFRFRHWNNQVVPLHDLLFKPKGMTITDPLKVFNDDVPYSLNTTTEYSKLYVKNGEIIMTLDSHPDFTQVVNVDLERWEGYFKGFTKPRIKSSMGTKLSNSFIHEDNYFGISLLRDTLKLEILNYNSKELLKNYTIANHKPIEIQNTPVIVTDGPYSEYRELDKTVQYFRKIDAKHFGVAVNNSGKDHYEVRIGGVVPAGKGGPSKAASGLGIGLSGIGILPVPLTGVSLSFGDYNGGRTVYIKSLLNLAFDHEEGDVPLNAFDRINEFRDGVLDYGINTVMGAEIFPKNYKKYSRQVVLHHLDDYMLGYYLKQENVYLLFKI